MRNVIQTSVLFLLLCVGGAVACPDNTKALPVELSITPSTIDLEVGDATQVVAIVRNGSQAVSFSSTDSRVASVSDAGLVTAVGAGSAVITATSTQDANARAATSVVVRVPIAVTLLPAAPPSMRLGEALQLAATVTGTTNTAVTWSSSSPATASITNTGIVTGLAVGTATISATSIANPAKFATAFITVSTPVAVSVSPAVGSVSVGQAGQLTATVSGTNNTAVVWTSGATSIASVSVTGVVTGVAAGSVAITVTSAADPTKSAIAQITVTASSAITIVNGAVITGLSGAVNSSRTYRITVPTGTGQLTVRTTAGTGDVDLYVRYLTPPDPSTTNTATSCASDGETTVEACTINNPAAGDWYIVVFGYLAYNGVTLSATTGVAAAVVIALTPTTVNVTVGQTRQLSATISGSANTGVTWASGNGAIASVNVSGLVTAIVAGSAIITARSVADPTKFAQATITVTPASTALNLSIPKAYVVQSVQNNGSIRLVAGKAGLIRAFLVASIANAVRPAVRFRVFNGTTLLSTTDVQAGRASVPLTSADGPLAQTWNVPIAAANVQAGLRIVFDVDPDNLIAESDKTDNSVFITPTVVSLPTFKARFVPIRQSANNQVGDVTVNNANNYMLEALSRHPIGAYNIDVRRVYTTTNIIGVDYANGWSPLLSEIYALQVAEDPTRFFYGVLKPSNNTNGTGLGYIGSPAAIGIDWENIRSQTAAHEWGHNFNRQHAPCGNPGNPDPKYPYANGQTGAWGFDAFTGSEKPPTYSDLMGYCDRDLQWVSDYTYDGVLSWRAASADAQSTAPAENSLIVWGRVTSRGLVLEPSFESVTKPRLPDGNGTTRLEGFDVDGARMFSYAFDGAVVADLANGDERHFAFAIPTRLLTTNRLDRMRLSASGGSIEQSSRVLAPAANSSGLRLSSLQSVTAVRVGAMVAVRWDAQSFPMVVVRDPRTSEILSLARGGFVSLPSSAPDVELQLSDGVRSSRMILPLR